METDTSPEAAAPGPSDDDADMTAFLAGRGGEDPLDDDPGLDDAPDEADDTDDADDGPDASDEPAEEPDEEPESEDEDEEIPEKPETKEEMEKAFKALTKKRQKVKLQAEEREHYQELKASFEATTKYKGELEQYATRLEEEHKTVLGELERARSSPSKALEAAGFTVDDLAHEIANPDAPTPTMAKRAEERRLQQQQQEKSERQKLLEENARLKKMETARLVSDRVMQDFQSQMDEFPAIQRWTKANPKEVLPGISQHIVSHYEKTGEILDTAQLFRQAENQLSARLAALGIDPAADPPQTRGPNTSGQPRRKQTSQGRPKPPPDDDLDDDIDTWLSKRNS